MVVFKIVGAGVTLFTSSVSGSPEEGLQADKQSATVTGITLHTVFILSSMVRFFLSLVEYLIDILKGLDLPDDLHTGILRLPNKLVLYVIEWQVFAVIKGIGYSSVHKKAPSSSGERFILDQFLP
jgi:hypothetical protein